MVGKDPGHAHEHDWLVATALAVRDRVVDRWMDATRHTYRDGRKRVYYFSLEFLIGRLLFDALGNLGITATAREALRDLGVDLDRLRKLEPDAALGNGGLGRLAACFMESMATLGIPAHGYGIRYDHGIFRQALKDGWQLELPEDWLSSGNPWEFERPEVIYTVASAAPSIGRRTRTGAPATSGIRQRASMRSPTTRRSPGGADGTSTRCGCGRRGRPTRCGSRISIAATTSARWPTACGWRPSRACSTRATRRRPGTSCACGRSSSSRRRRCRTCCAGTRRSTASSPRSPITSSIQLNDTHPAIAVPELMRLLIDVHGMPWELAWNITTSVFNYTNHTLLPEALETWPVSLIENMLPRHMQIIYLINALHLDAQRATGMDDDRFLSSISLIEENQSRRVRMGHLAFLGSHRVNGVSALHTELMRRTVFRDLHTIYPERIVNKTNGITFRRWLFQANPGLTELIVDAIGTEVLDDVVQLEALVPFADDAVVPRAIRMTCAARTRWRLARLVAERLGVGLDPDALFDVQIKRIHEYKRQLLNILETIASTTRCARSRRAPGFRG